MAMSLPSGDGIGLGWTEAWFESSPRDNCSGSVWTLLLLPQKCYMCKYILSTQDHLCGEEPNHMTGNPIFAEHRGSTRVNLEKIPNIQV